MIVSSNVAEATVAAPVSPVQRVVDPETGEITYAGGAVIASGDPAGELPPWDVAGTPAVIVPEQTLGQPEEPEREFCRSRLKEATERINRILTGTTDQIAPIVREVYDHQWWKYDFESIQQWAEQALGMTERNLYYILKVTGIDAQIQAERPGAPRVTATAHARALGRVKPERRADAWEQTHKLTGGKPTEAMIDRVAAAMDALDSEGGDELSARVDQDAVRRATLRNIVDEMEAQWWKLDLEYQDDFLARIGASRGANQS